MDYKVMFAWDAEARVWVAISDTIPRLVPESSSLDTLVGRVIYAVPELPELNGKVTGGIFKLPYHPKGNDSCSIAGYPVFWRMDPRRNLTKYRVFILNKIRYNTI